MKFKTWTDFHHQINQIYHLIIAVSLIPFAYVFLEIDSSRSFSIEDGLLSILVISLLIAGVGMLSWYSWKGKSTQCVVSEEMLIRDKLIEYRKKHVLRYFFLLVAGLLSLVGLWMITSYLFVLAYFAVLVQYSFLRPSLDRVIRDLMLNKKEREMITKGELA